MLQRFYNSFEKFWLSILDQAPNIIIGLVLLVVFIVLGSILKSIVKKRLLSKMHDALLVNFIGRVINLTMITLGVVIFLNQLGLGKAAGGLMAGAGVSAIVIGFAFKDIGENFLAGFFLAFSRPFGIGDVIEVSDFRGTVKQLSFRVTHIRTFDGKDIYMPNAMLFKNPLINYTRDGLQRFDFVVGIDYGDNMTEAGKVIMEYLEKEQRIEQSDDLAPFIQLDEFSTSTVNIRIFYWINSYDFTGSIATLKTAVMNNVLTALIDSGFSLPADIVELKIYQEGQPIPLMMKPYTEKKVKSA